MQPIPSLELLRRFDFIKGHICVPSFWISKNCPSAAGLISWDVLERLLPESKHLIKIDAVNNHRANPQIRTSLLGRRLHLILPSPSLPFLNFFLKEVLDKVHHRSLKRAHSFFSPLKPSISPVISYLCQSDITLLKACLPSSLTSSSYEFLKTVNGYEKYRDGYR